MSTPDGQYATDVTVRNGSRSNRYCRLRGGGRTVRRPPRDRRQIVNGLLYLTKTGSGVVALLFWAVENRV